MTCISVAAALASVTLAVLFALSNMSDETVDDPVVSVAVLAELEFEYISRFDPKTLAGRVQFPAVASARTFELRVPEDGTFEHAYVAFPKVVVPVPAMEPDSVTVDVAMRVRGVFTVRDWVESIVVVDRVRSLLSKVYVPEMRRL